MLLKIIFTASILLQVADTPLNSPIDELLERYTSSATERWEAEIIKLEELDRRQSDPEHAILFVGSSSIRLWQSIEEDLAPWPVIRRGFGGAKFSDLIVYADRLLTPHDYRALVVFVANDISGSRNSNSVDRSPEEVEEMFRHFVQLARQHKPDRPIFFVSITPTSSRFQVWEQANRANELIRNFADADELIHFIDTRQYFLTTDGYPDDSLFVKDRLHLNPAGYRRWASVIRDELEHHLGNPSP